MTETGTQSRKRAKSGGPQDAPPQDSEKPDDKAPIVEVVAEGGDQVQPPPPEVVEPDPELTPEEAEEARKKYLLTRFWISAPLLKVPSASA